MRDLDLSSFSSIWLFGVGDDIFSGQFAPIVGMAVIIIVICAIVELLSEKPREWSQSFRVVIELPIVESVHESLIAFCSTYSAGPWQPDGTVQSSHFALHFRRGRWNGHSPVSPSAENLKPVVTNETPAQLEILIRPSPDDFQITIRHKFHWKILESHRAAAWQATAESVREEINDLCSYLQKCYRLEEPPKILK